MSRMVRKQIYLPKRQEALLRRLAKVRGITEAEVIRTALDDVLSGGGTRPLQPDPEAAIIPYEDYLKYFKAYEDDVHRRFDAMLKRMEEVNAGYTDEEVERDVEEASRIVRARRRAREQHAAYKSGAGQSRKTKK
jgi:hypothetical protein